MFGLPAAAAVPCHPGQMQAPASNAASAEIEHCLSLRIPAEFEDSPLRFWQCHEQSFPLLSKVAEVYLSMSASSVPVECMFSTTGLISNGKRSSI